MLVRRGQRAVLMQRCWEYKSSVIREHIMEVPQKLGIIQALVAHSVILATWKPKTGRITV
jgi:hypothetical protein